MTTRDVSVDCTEAGPAAGAKTETALPEWVETCAEDALVDGRGRMVRAAGREIALFRVQGRLHALGDSCPHNGASLAGGRLDGSTVTCPAHGLRFDLSTGCMRGKIGLRTPVYPVRVRNGRVEIDVRVVAQSDARPPCGAM